MSLTTPNQPDHLLLKKRRKSARPGVTLNTETQSYCVKLRLNSDRKLHVLKGWESLRHGHIIKFVGESRIDGCPIFNIKCVKSHDEVAYYDQSNMKPVYYCSVSATDIFDGFEICGTVLRYGEFNIELIKSLEDYVPGLANSPYLPMTSSAAIMDPGFEPKKLIKSRYAIKQVNNKFYGVINVNGRKTNPRYLLLLK